MNAGAPGRGPGTAATGWRGAAIRAISVVVGTLAVFWLMQVLAEHAVRPAGVSPPASVVVVAVDESGRPLPGAVPRSVLLGPWPSYSAPISGERASFIHEFDVPAGRTGGLALFVPRLGGVTEVRVNDHVVLSRPRSAVEPIIGGLEGMLLDLPAEVVREHGNRLELVVRQVSPAKSLWPIHVAPRPLLETAHAWRGALTRDVVIAAMAVALFVALLSFAIGWGARDRASVLLFGLVMALWSARNLIYLGVDGAWAVMARDIVYLSVTFALLFACAAFANAWTRGPAWVHRGAVAGFLASIVVVAVSFGMGHQTGRFVSLGYGNVVGAVVFAAIGARLILHYARTGVAALAEAFAFLLCVVAGIVDIADYALMLRVPFRPELEVSVILVPVAGIVFALTMVAAMGKRTLEAHRAVQAMNATLAERLAEKEAEIAATYAIRRETEKRRELMDERQRIMRDMHDGMGGQLLGLILQARRPEAEVATILPGLEGSLEDLRLIVDSLDFVGDSLDSALGAFRARVAPKCAAAGVTLDWRIGDTGTSGRLGPDAVLQIYRLLQEAVTNAIRHGQPSRVCIESKRIEGLPPLIELSVTDDGKGMLEGVVPGKGIQSMRARAARLGGTLGIVGGPGGTSLTIWIPA